MTLKEKKLKLSTNIAYELFSESYEYKDLIIDLMIEALQKKTLKELKELR